MNPKYDLSKEKVLYAIGYGHLDSQWRWDYATTIDEFIKNTLQENFDLFEKYPEYVFNFSGSRRYAMMKEYYPQDYEKLKGYIKQGRWFVCGSSVDEGDVLMPSPESIIRQVLYGNEYFRTEFGVESCDYMLPDCFGFSYTLPSILSHCGIKGFSTQKIGAKWKSARNQPFSIGIWYGPDGNGIIAALNPGPYSDSIKAAPDSDLKWAERIDNNGKEYGVFADYHYYGVGDRGGSVHEYNVKRYVEAVQNGNGLYKIYLTSSDRLFRDVSDEQKKKLPQCTGEFLLTEHSAGSLTSQSYMKRWNRKNEYLADAAEKVSVMADCLGNSSYPFDKLYAAWMLVLGNQMHDILPGTSIPSAYNYSYNDEVAAMNMFSSVIKSSAGAVISAMDTTGSGKSVVVYNCLSIPRTEAVQVSLNYDNVPPQCLSVFDADGAETPSQILSCDGKSISLLFIAKVPSVGFAVYDVRPNLKPSNHQTGLTVTGHSIENNNLKVEIGENGNVTSIYDKKAKREVLQKPIQLAFLRENPVKFPAWNMDWEDRQKPPIDYVGGPAKIKIVEEGPVRAGLVIERQGRNSFFTQYIRLGCGDCANVIEVKNDVDWQSAGVSLKAQFPLAVSNPLATYTLGLGTIERGNNEPAKYEVPSHQWFDLTDKDNSYGVSILDDCKYGSDKPADNMIRLTLLYTPQAVGTYDDQASQDWGRHEFSYGIYCHEGNWLQARSQWQGRRFNSPLIAFESEQHKGILGRRFSIAYASTDQIEIKALKKAQNGDSYIIRVQEATGKAAENITLSIASGISWAVQIDGQERKIGQAVLKDGSIVINMEANGIRSFAVKPNSKEKISAPEYQYVNLDYNKDVLSNDWDRGNGAMDFFGWTIPAELLPDTMIRDAIGFKFGSGDTDQKNALICQGQQIDLPQGNYDKLYILAAASENEDTNGIFILDGREIAIKVQSWTGFVGQYDNRKWDIQFRKADWSVYNGQLMPVGLEKGYIKRDDIAWFCSHRHIFSHNDAYSYCYIYKYSLDLKGAKTIILPHNPKITIFAMTVAANPNDKIRSVMPLYDDFDVRKPVKLRHQSLGNSSIKTGKLEL